MGLLFGSFANVAIHRWPRGGSVVVPAGSHCPACDAPIAWHDNVPVASWLRLRGRCRACGAPIAARYPIVELVTAAVWLGTAAVLGPDVALVAYLAFGWALVVGTAIDLEHRIIPNRLTLRLPLVLLPLLAVDAAVDGQWQDLRRAVIAGVAVPGTMLLISEAYRLLRGKVGIGMGDIKLAISIGLAVGYLGGWELVIFAYGTIISAVVIVIVLLATGRARMATRIPYGPYLAVGSLIAVLAGGPLAPRLATWFGF